MRPTAFPTTDVCRILNLAVPTRGDTYVGRDFTLNEMSELEAVGALDLEEQQNDSPMIGSFLTFFRAESYKDLKFIGYVVFPPRSDARVSIEGFECRPTKDQEKILRKTFRRADEFECEDGYCRAWWD